MALRQNKTGQASVLWSTITTRSSPAAKDKSGKQRSSTPKSSVHSKAYATRSLSNAYGKALHFASTTLRSSTTLERRLRHRPRWPSTFSRRQETRIPEWFAFVSIPDTLGSKETSWLTSLLKIAPKIQLGTDSRQCYITGVIYKAA